MDNALFNRWLEHLDVRTHLRSEGCPHPGARKYCPECGQSMV
jgi:hypothetical protein